jgi:hypothetical protein
VSEVENLVEKSVSISAFSYRAVRAMAEVSGVAEKSLSMVVRGATHDLLDEYVYGDGSGRLPTYAKMVRDANLFVERSERDLDMLEHQEARSCPLSPEVAQAVVAAANGVYDQQVEALREAARKEGVPEGDLPGGEDLPLDITTNASFSAGAIQMVLNLCALRVKVTWSEMIRVAIERMLNIRLWPHAVPTLGHLYLTSEVEE